MRRCLTLTLVTLLALGLAACSPVKNVDEAADQIDRFQSHFSYGDIDEMYLMTSPAFREATPLKDLRSRAMAINARLGPVKATERASFSIKNTSEGTRTVVTMNTRYGQGEGTETYTFIGNGENMRIEGWDVSSSRLAIAADEINPLRETDPIER